jgi:hypothetical protein
MAVCCAASACAGEVEVIRGIDPTSTMAVVRRPFGLRQHHAAHGSPGWRASAAAAVDRGQRANEMRLADKWRGDGVPELR